MLPTKIPTDGLSMGEKAIELHAEWVRKAVRVFFFLKVGADTHLLLSSSFKVLHLMDDIRLMNESTNVE
jgi:hypothetical protein